MFIGFIAIVGIIYMLFFNKSSSINPAQQVSPTPESGKQINNNENSDKDTPKRRISANDLDTEDTIEETIAVKSREEINKEDLKRIASSFVERFGSYSNQSNYSNIKDLKMFMSNKMRDWADSFIVDQLKNARANSIYYGIITKVSTEELLEYDDVNGKVSVLVNTRRREAIGASNNFSEVFDQSIVVSFVKDRGVWKVDSANWNEK